MPATSVISHQLPREPLHVVLLKEFGPLMGGEDLRRALGFRTWSAFARAVRIGEVGVRILEIPGRRGKFALTQEVADWLDRLSTKPQEIDAGVKGPDSQGPRDAGGPQNDL